MMKPKKTFLLFGLLILLSSLLPIHVALASPALQLPPFDMFQLPWEQGEAWVTFDGFDNGTKRGWGSSHNYLNGGAVDFGPRPDIRPGDDTSNAWVTAAAAGTVIERGICHLKIDHGNGWLTEYQFLANFQVDLGEEVYRNQRLAIIADGVRNPFCPPALYPDIPHVHFSLRPTMLNAAFAGWEVGYDYLTNVTTIAKEGETRHPYDGKPLLNIPYLQIAERGLLELDTHYRGSVDAYRYEKWTFSLAETRSVTLTATPATDGLQPLIVLFNASEVEVARGVGTLTSFQPAGTYFVQIQPQSGQGFYDIILQESDAILDPFIAVVAPAHINMGERVSVQAYLGNIPAEGYTSVEVTCPYDRAFLSVDHIVATGLFGDDPATAIYGPANGSFIYSAAGSHGQRAFDDQTAFNFDVIGLAVGETTLRCTARISVGDGVLTEIIAIGTEVSISDAPMEGAVVFSDDGMVSSALLGGQTLASKPVTVSMFDASNNLLNTVSAGADGAFAMGGLGGTYTLVASASGFLPARGVFTFTEGETAILPTVSLLAGDIDGNFVIDQYDALTIGMNYNLTSPDAANLNADGTINVLDLEVLAANYRKSGMQRWE